MKWSFTGTKAIHSLCCLWQKEQAEHLGGPVRVYCKILTTMAICAGASVLGTTCMAQDIGTGAVQGVDAQEAGFRTYLAQVRQRALREGVTAATLDRVLPSITYNDRVVRLDRQQPEGASDAPIPNFAPYKARHVDASRISRGRAKYAELRPLLKRIEDETGVPEEIMIAIYGHETNYGSVTGNFNAPEALASLAYEGRRRALFEGELVAVLKMIDKGVPRKDARASRRRHARFHRTAV